MKQFITENFLLQSKSAQTLYHDYAKEMPIFDYHCHLPPQDIASHRQFSDMQAIWLEGDHYKWRALRANGIGEKFITGSASGFEKFKAWAETVPYTLRNPLYHWTHLELNDPFSINHLVLNGNTAKEVWDTCNEKLAEKDFSTVGLLNHFNVNVVGTTDDPCDDLANHKKIKDDSTIKTNVVPTFRPDPVLGIENGEVWVSYLNKLSKASGIAITDWDSLKKSLSNRMDFFETMGCKLSDHGILKPYGKISNEDSANTLIKKALKGESIPVSDAEGFKATVFHFLGCEYGKRKWTMQLHLGPLRNNNLKMFKELGPDAGFDSMGDEPMAMELSSFLSQLAEKDLLPKTIVYNLNPKDNDVLATMIGNFQDGITPGKLQFGSGWWFLDQKDGMEKQMNTLSNMGLLSRFVGMLTDSRSFLSYSRHEYFRRILCNLLGDDIEKGLLPSDLPLIGNMVQDICFRNAENYFGLKS